MDRTLYIAAILAVSTVVAACDSNSGDGPAIIVDPPDAYTVELAFPDLTFSQPVGMTQNPADGVFYVIEKAGRVRSFTESSTATELALDITGRVNSSGNETGLLGIAFHPDVAANGAVYLSYTTIGLLRLQLSYFPVDSASRTIDGNSETLIHIVNQPASNHNGGHITFEPGTNNLAWGIGDGGGAGDPGNHGQNPFTLLGTISRLDMTTPNAFAIPTDNPFADGTSGASEVFLYGLRNPWRFQFDRETGELWIGDVGQNTFEEIDIGVSGGNYGWRCYEGDAVFQNDISCPPVAELEFPVATYGRSSGTSVTGGFVYRGTELPGLVGTYLYGDFVSGRIWSLSAGGASELLVESSLAIASFSEDADGEIYIVDFGGQIYRLTGSF